MYGHSGAAFVLARGVIINENNFFNFFTCGSFNFLFSNSGSERGMLGEMMVMEGVNI